MSKILFALPFLAFALIAAKDPPPPPPKPPVSLTAPAEVAADPANRWTLELSNGGKVVIQLRPDIAPQHASRSALFGIQQGGLDEQLREGSAHALIDIGFDGYAIGLGLLLVRFRCGHHARNIGDGH